MTDKKSKLTAKEAQALFADYIKADKAIEQGHETKAKVAEALWNAYPNKELIYQGQTYIPMKRTTTKGEGDERIETTSFMLKRKGTGEALTIG